MAPQGASAQELEASVIAGFNSKLVDRANQLKANHSDVSPCITLNIVDFKGYSGFNLVVGLERGVHARVRQSDCFRLR